METVRINQETVASGMCDSIFVLNCAVALKGTQTSLEPDAPCMTDINPVDKTCNKSVTGTPSHVQLSVEAELCLCQLFSQARRAHAPSSPAHLAAAIR